MAKATEKVPPDGGYGWVIVLASGLNYFICASLGQLFGMIFQESFFEMKLSATQESFIIDLNSGIGMMTGLLNGPLINRFGYRKISYVSATLVFVGMFSLGFARNLGGYLLVYGFITSAGVGLSFSTYSLAVNSYFKEKRNKAASLTLTIAGLGPIIMPQLVNFLMIHYDSHEVSLILSAICAHSFIFASLLQPVKKHMKEVKVENGQSALTKIVEEEEDKGSEEDFQEEFYDEVFMRLPKSPLRLPFVKAFSLIEHRKDTPLAFYYDQDAAGVYGIDSTIIGTSMVSLPQAAVRAVFPPLPPKNTKTKYQWWRSASSVNLESSVDLFDESRVEEKVYNELSVVVPERSRWKRFVQAVVELFDLTLLKDPVYCNILMGLSFAVFAEVDFSMTTVFILTDYGMHTGDIAEFLSILGMADIVFRFLAPYIGEFLKKPPRVMYLLSLLAIVSTRFMLMFITDIRYLFLIAVALGCAKGLRTVFMVLIMPTYVPIERLATASGIQMIVNGIFMFVGGPLIGIVRDATGSYQLCIIIFNCLTLITVVSWTAEMMLLKFYKKKDDVKPAEVLEQENNLLKNNL